LKNNTTTTQRQPWKKRYPDKTTLTQSKDQPESSSKKPSTKPPNKAE